MNPAAEDWARVSPLLDELFELAVEERGRRLAQACEGDDVLKGYVERLLAADSRAGTFLQSAAEAGFHDLVAEATSAADAVDTEEGLTGARIGPWRLVRELGRGGMGAVFLAERDDGQFQQRVALKVVKRGMDTDEVLRRFLAERRILAQLTHPHIARLLDGGVTEDGRPYFAMEHVDGTPIVAYCLQGGLPLEARLRLFQDVCDAVSYAHRNLVVHRDLKPSNILVTAAGQAKLLDFGIAKLLGADQGLTLTGERVMTPEYAAPEQARGEVVTTATDVFALGLLLYELARGERWRRSHPRGEPRVGHGDLDAIVQRALRDEPDQRYASAEALADDVRRLLQGLPVLARKGSRLYRTRKFMRRHRVGVSAAALVLLASLAGIGGTWRQSRLARAEAAKATAVKDFLVSIFVVSDPNQAKGQPVTARELLDRGGQRIEQDLRAQPEIAAELLAVMGTLHNQLGSHDRATPLLERSLALRRQKEGGDSTAVADGLALLADAHTAAGRFDEAERYWREALALHRRRLGPGHHATVNDADGLARLLVNRGRYDEARPLIDDTLAQVRRQRGEENEDYASALTTLQMMLWAQGRYDEAEPVMRRALDLYRRLYGEDHMRVSESYGNLGTLAIIRGDILEAERMQRKNLAVKTKLYGPDNPLLWVTLNNLAKVLQEKGETDEALALQRRALALRTAQLGEGNPQLAVHFHNIGLLLRERGEYPEAERLLREAMAMNRKLLGDEHVSQMVTMGSLALVLSESGKRQEAETLFRRSIGLFRGKGLEANAKVPELLEGYGVLLVALGRTDEAERLLREAVERRRKALGEDAWRTAAAKVSLASCLEAMGRHEASGALAAEALPALRRQRGDAHPSTRIARSLVGER